MTPVNKPSNHDNHNEWLARSLTQIQSVKVGMSRRDLLDVFMTEGGLSSWNARKYAFKGSPYIKVDVVFQRRTSAGGGQRENLDDKIISISKPYIEFPISD